ncbi:ABC transporter ATP-binding protein [Aminobacter sp. MSH1]|uniref:ABC transporter ATP-binding protein n=1 Tax=Aminobacter sp. MSH1 TaxID=374606 RepID=UPI000D38E9AB|nr:ABC transporter ATP-binding protein [Aminobacter sp. MSH1]
MTGDKVLEVDGLTIALREGGYQTRLVDSVSFDLARGETISLVGESGCGKTMTALALMRLEPSPGVKIVAGSIRLFGQDLVPLSEVAMSTIRTRRISMIFQDPMSALNPTMTVGKQVLEAISAHMDLSSGAARERAIDLLREVRLPDPAAIFDSYPHELSGGMRQRVVIAIALSCEPEVVVADEPTTALDVTVQAKILRLLKDVQERRGIGIILITHDLSVVRQHSDRAVVMYAGRIAESGPTNEILRQSAHPYTKGLIGAIPGLTQLPRRRLTEVPGGVPAPGTVGDECAFANRCAFRLDICVAHRPPLTPIGEHHEAACIRVAELA